MTNQGCAELKAAGIVGCIIQPIVGLDGNTYTTQQLDACRRNGLRIQAYVWAFPGVHSTVASRLFMLEGFDLEALWLDVEDEGLTIADVDRSLAACDLYMGGKLTGVYSGRWFFENQDWLGLTKWSDRPLWDSRFDGVADVDAGFVPYGGWTQCAIKQYRGTSSIGSVHQIDLNVMRA